MSTTNNISLIQSISALSMLQSANKQPELALQLILQTLAETPSVAKVQKGTAPPVSSAPPGTGKLIDTVA